MDISFLAYIAAVAGNLKVPFNPIPVFNKLNQSGIQWVLVGGMAVNAHGFDSGTKDINIFIQAVDLEVVKRLGAPFLKENPFRINVDGMILDILLELKGVNFRSAWQDHVDIDIDGTTVPVLSKEHLIFNKRAVGRHQDLADVERLQKQG